MFYLYSHKQEPVHLNNKSTSQNQECTIHFSFKINKEYRHTGAEARLFLGGPLAPPKISKPSNFFFFFFFFFFLLSIGPCKNRIRPPLKKLYSNYKYNFFPCFFFKKYIYITLQIHSKHNRFKRKKKITIANPPQHGNPTWQYQSKN
jgi:hypothetical protein